MDIGRINCNNMELFRNINSECMFVFLKVEIIKSYPLLYESKISQNNQLFTELFTLSTICVDVCSGL